MKEVFMKDIMDAYVESKWNDEQQRRLEMGEY